MAHPTRTSSTESPAAPTPEQFLADTLKASAIGPAVAAKRGYRAVRDADYEQFGKPENIPPALWSAGIWLPLYPPQSDAKLPTGQLRPIKPKQWIDDKGKEHAPKYAVGKGKERLIDALHYKPQCKRVWIVEGVKQADAIATAAPEESVVAIQGCWGWSVKDSKPKQIRSELIALCKGRSVIGVFDGDVVSNDGVRAAADQFLAIVKATDAVGTGKLLLFPQDADNPKAGVDDWLGKGGDWDQRKVVAAFPKEAKGKPKKAKPVKAVDMHTDHKAAQEVDRQAKAQQAQIPAIPAPIDWDLPNLDPRLVPPNEWPQWVNKFLSWEPDKDALITLNTDELAPYSVPACKLLLTFMGVQVRYNRRKEVVEVNVQGRGWAVADRAIKLALREEVASAFWYFPTLDDGKKAETPTPLRWSYGVFSELLEAWAVYEKVDDVKDWLETLQGQWDGTERIATVLHDHFGAQRNAVNDAASAGMFFGTCVMTMQPGSLFRGIPTLSGQQDNGKSSLIHHLLPEPLRQYANPGLSLSGNDKDRTEGTLGMAIVELGELAGASRTEINELKSWLTRRTDVVRLSYRPDPVVIPRRCMTIATMNTGQTLPADPSGTTRWVVVECPKGCHVEATITDELRQQWFAEAMTRLYGEQQLIKEWATGMPYAIRQELGWHNEKHEGRDESYANAIALLDATTGETGTALDWAQAAGILDRQVPIKNKDGRVTIEIITGEVFDNTKQERDWTAELRASGFERVLKRTTEDGKKKRIRVWRAP